MHKILILLSTYNGEKYLATQLDSILNQTVIDDIHIFVRDDGSKDSTIDILDRYVKTGKLTYFQGNNVGSASSFCQLLQDSPPAEYYAFCDQDDYWMPNKVENGIQALQGEACAGLYCTKKTIVDNDLEPLCREDTEPVFGLLNCLFFPNYASGCTMVFNDKLRDVFLLYKDLTNDMYHDSWLFKLATIFGKVIYSNESCILYRQHGNNVVGAMLTGKNLLRKKLRTFDFTLSKYRNRNWTSRMAAKLLDGYGEFIHKEDREILHNIANGRNSLKCRLKLLLEPGLSRRPFYQYIILKIYILLGWF